MSSRSADGSSPSSSNSSSAREFLKGVQQLIQSDEQEKNSKKLIELRGEFQVLRKIQPTMSNSEKLAIFLRDQQFKHKASEKITPKITTLNNDIILKAYLTSTRYRGVVVEEFDENDLVNVFNRFGQVNNLSINGCTAYVNYQQHVSAFLAIKVLNGFSVNENLWITVRVANQEENDQAAYLFFMKQNQAKVSYEIAGGISYPYPQINPVYTSKFIAKFQVLASNLSQFKIAQRIIGPHGTYMKKILEKVCSLQPTKYSLKNIEKVIKMRLRGKGSGYIENQLGFQSDDIMHLFISSKEKVFYDMAVEEVDKLFVKVFQDYKFSYQKQYLRYPEGTAYRLLESQGNSFIQIRRMNFEQLKSSIDLLSLEKKEKLSQKQIDQKINEREKARKMGNYKRADEIRNWLKEKGVIIIDQKGAKGKARSTTWSYINP